MITGIARPDSLIIATMSTTVAELNRIGLTGIQRCFQSVDDIEYEINGVLDR